MSIGRVAEIHCISSENNNNLQRDSRLITDRDQISDYNVIFEKAYNAALSENQDIDILNLGSPKIQEE